MARKKTKKRCAKTAIRDSHKRQCELSATEGSEFCKLHSPKKGTGEFVYKAHFRYYDNKPEVVKMEVAKRSKKSITLMGRPMAVSCREKVSPEEVFETWDEAILDLMKQVLERKANLEKELSKAKEDHHACKLLFQTGERE